MNDEFFDLVDERDRVIGRATRRAVHARGLRHRAIHVLIFDPQGRVYLQKRSMAKDVAPGVWDSSCSGHVDSGETYDEAAVRELREELGIILESPPARWFRAAAGPETGQEFVWVYRMNHGGPMRPNPDEIERGEWVEPAQVDARVSSRPGEFSGAFRFLWDRSRQSGGGIFSSKGASST